MRCTTSLFGVLLTVHFFQLKMKIDKEVNDLISGHFAAVLSIVLLSDGGLRSLASIVIILLCLLHFHQLFCPRLLCLQIATQTYTFSHFTNSSETSVQLCATLRRDLRGCQTSDKVGRLCGRGLVARQNRPTISVKHDTADIFVCYFIRYQLAQQSNADHKIILASLFSASNKRK